MKKKNISSGNNIWDKEGFRMCGLGENCKIIAKIKYCRQCIRWSRQRVIRGFADCDRWNMYGYLQKLIPDMLQDLRDNRWGSSGYLGENYTNDEGILMNDTCHEEWNNILERMIFLWRESDEDTCTRKNPYEEEHLHAFEEFIEKYGLFGEKLQTEEELKENRKRGGGGIMHFMREVLEYKELDDKYSEEEKRLEEYRNRSKDEAMDMLKEYFFSLWD